MGFRGRQGRISRFRHLTQQSGDPGAVGEAAPILRRRGERTDTHANTVIGVWHPFLFWAGSIGDRFEVDGELWWVVEIYDRIICERELSRTRHRSPNPKSPRDRIASLVFHLIIVPN